MLYKYTRFSFKCDNPECKFEWDSINKHDIYCEICRSFGMAIGQITIEVDKKGEKKVSET